MADPAEAGGSPRPGVIWQALSPVVSRAAMDIVDVGGGTGGFAVPLAGLGHRATVVDPSPDALAALQRRAQDAGVEVRAVQGDANGLLKVVDAGTADLVLCHGVLEQVEDVEAAVAALAQVLRPRGALSIVAANRDAVVIARAVSGRFSEAQHALSDPNGRWGVRDPLIRRFREGDLVGLIKGAGLDVLEVHGVRTLSDLVPGALIDADPDAHDALLELEAATADQPAFRAIAAQLHVLARKP